nr:hypothetical protein [Tanacetum cinerariifolium]
MWAEVGEGQLIRHELVQKTTEKISQIKDRLTATRDHQKSYADKRMKPVEFNVGHVAYRLDLPEELKAGSENRPPMLNKENYVPWVSRLLRYAKSRPNGKLIHNSIINGPYVRRMISEPGDPNCEVPTILLGLPEDIYAAVDSCETAQEIWLRVQEMMKGFDIGIQEKKAKLFNEWERFTSNDGESIESYYHRFLKLMNDLKRNKYFPEKIASNLKFLNNLQPEWSRHVTIVHQTKDLHTADYTQLYDSKGDQPSFNQNYMQQPMPNPEDITDLTTAMNMALALMAKAFKLNYSTPTNNNQMISSNLRNRQIAQMRMNMGQDRQMQMVGVQNPRIQNVVQRNANQNPNVNDNLVAARAEADLDEIEEVNTNCILMANLQQASTSGTQTDKAPVYDSDGSAEVHNYENCYDNEIFNMFTQEEQYTELLEPIPEPYQVPQNDNNVISEVSSVEQSGGTVEQHPANVEETRVLYDSLYNNVAIEVDKVNTVNRKFKETNVKLTKAAKFVEDFKSLAKEADESLAKHKTLELEIKRLLRAVVSQDIIFVVQNNSVVETSNLQTELERTKERFENCIIKKENEYANFGMIGTKSMKNVFDQKDTTSGKSANTKFANQSILRKPPKVGEIHALSKPVTSNSIPTPQESKAVKNNNVISPGMFRINPFKPSREENHVPNKVRASVRTKPIIVLQPPVITKKVVNSDSNCLSSTGVDNTKTRRPQPRSNTKNDRVPS